MRRVYPLVVLACFGLLAFLNSSKAHAQSATPPPSATPTVTPYAPPTCYPVATSTSVLPTVELPTFEGWSTPDPNATIYPTGTPDPNATGTAIPSPTTPPSPTATQPQEAMYYAVPAIGGNLQFSGGGSASAVVSGCLGGDTLAGGSVLVSGLGNSTVYKDQGVWLRIGGVFDNFISRAIPPVQTWWYDNFTSGITAAEILGMTSGDRLLSSTYSPVYSNQTWYIGAWAFNVGDFRQGSLQNGQLLCYGSHYVPITPSPTPIVGVGTGTPSSCLPYGSVIDSELVGFSPITIRAGACYTLLPAANFEVPDAVLLAAPFEIPAEIGVPGIDFCTQYIDTTMRFLGFDFLSVASFLVSVICAISIAREFRK